MKKKQVREGLRALVLSSNRQYAGKEGEISQVLYSNVELELPDELIWVDVKDIVIWAQGKWRGIEDIEREGLLPE